MPATSAAMAAAMMSFVMALPLAMAGMTVSQRGEIDRPQTVERTVDGRHRIFEPGCTIEQQRAFVAPDAPVGDTLVERRVGRGPFRTQQQSFCPRKLVDRRGNGIIGHRDGEPAALAHSAPN